MGLFTSDGRDARLKYFAINLLTFPVVFALAFAAGFVIGDPDIAGIVGGVMGVLGFFVVLAAVVRRLHDLNRSGFHYFLLLVPFYNIYLCIILLFQPGTTGGNIFGEDPLGGGR